MSVSTRALPTFSLCKRPSGVLELLRRVLPLVCARSLDVLGTLFLHGAQHPHTLGQHLLVGLGITGLGQG